MFALFRDVLGQEMVNSRSSRESLVVLSISNPAKDTLWVYLLNKKDGNEPAEVLLKPEGFHFSQTESVYFSASGTKQARLRFKKRSEKRREGKEVVNTWKN